MISADAAIENAIGTLTANLDNVANYNSIFSSDVQPANNSFSAANAALGNLLGLTSTT